MVLNLLMGYTRYRLRRRISRRRISSLCDILAHTQWLPEETRPLSMGYVLTLSRLISMETTVYRREYHTLRTVVPYCSTYSYPQPIPGISLNKEGLSQVLVIPRYQNLPSMAAKRLVSIQLPCTQLNVDWHECWQQWLTDTSCHSALLRAGRRKDIYICKF